MVCLLQVISHCCAHHISVPFHDTVYGSSIHIDYFDLLIISTLVLRTLPFLHHHSQCVVSVGETTRMETNFGRRKSNVSGNVTYQIIRSIDDVRCHLRHSQSCPLLDSPHGRGYYRIHGSNGLQVISSHHLLQYQSTRCETYSTYFIDYLLVVCLSGLMLRMY